MVGVLSLPRWVRAYRRADLRRDLLAGLVVAALAVPQSLGYAVVAHVPVEVGLYTLPPALLAYALVGSSRLLVVGPVSTVSVLSGSLVSTLSGGDQARAVQLTGSLAVAAGLVLLAGGLLRVGWIAEFLSEPILAGFVTGLVVLVVLGELPGLLGLQGTQGNLLTRVWALLAGVPDTHPLTAAVGAVALALLFGGARLAPRLPWSLVVLVVGIVAAHAGRLADRGVALVGTVPSGLHLPQLPVPAAGDVPALLTGGLAVGAVGLAEGLAAARLFAARTGDRIEPDSELLGHGAACLAAGLSGGMGVAGSLTKTAAAARAGARTQLTGVVAAGLVVAVLLLLAPLVGALPKVVLSAIVVQAVWGLARMRAFARYRAVRRNDAVAAVVALGGVLALGPLAGLGVAVAQSILGLVYRSIQVTLDEMGKVPGEKAAWGAVARHPERRTVDGVLVLRLSGPVFWANAAMVTDEITLAVDAQPGTRVVVLDLEATNQLDITSADRLGVLLAQLRAREVDLYLVRVFEDVRLVLTRSGFLAALDPTGRMWHSISAGVRAARKAIRAAADGLPTPVLEGPYPAAGEDDEGPLAGPDDERIAPRADQRPRPLRRPRDTGPGTGGR